MGLFGLFSNSGTSRTNRRGKAFGEALMVLPAVAEEIFVRDAARSLGGRLDNATAVAAGRFAETG